MRGSRVPQRTPEYELTWTSNRIVTDASTTYSGWRSIYFGWPIYMISPGSPFPPPNGTPAVFSEEDWVVGNYYSSGNPSNKETTRAVCSLTRDGVVVARLYAIETGYSYHRLSCTVAAASNEDPDCVDLIITLDAEKEVEPLASAPDGYYENLQTDSEFFDLMENVSIETGPINHLKNVNFDTAWNYLTFTPSDSLAGQYVHTVFSLGGGNPDLGVYEFVGSVDTSYNGGLYNPNGWAVSAPLGEQGIAYVNCLLFSGYTVVKSSIYGKISTASPNNNQWPDLWSTTTAPDVQRLVNDQHANYGLGNWILLTCPDGVSQLCIMRTGSYPEDMYWYWSPSGAFAGDSVDYPKFRPTATDEILIDDKSETLSNGINYFYAFKGMRGAEVTSRILVTYSPSVGQEQIIRLLCCERFVTDIPEATLTRNVCFLRGYTGYYHYPPTKNGGGLLVFMPGNKSPGICVSGLQTTQYFGSQDTSDNKGTIDSAYRLEPLYLSLATGGEYQFYGYIPDMYWGDVLVLNATNKTYTFNDSWTKFGPLVLPKFTTLNAPVGDYTGLISSIRIPGKLNVDVVKPTFAGVVSAEVIDDNTVRLTWESGTDDVSAPEDLKYEIHYSRTPSAPFEIRGYVVGGG